MVKKTTKYFQVEVSRVKRVVLLLQEIIKIQNITINKTVENFFSEAQGLDGEVKNYDAVKSIKIIAEIDMLFSGNSSDKPQEVEEFFEDMAYVVKKDSHLAFYKAYSLVHKILSASKFREFDGALLYFVSPEQDVELCKIKISLSRILEDSPNKNDKKTMAFSKIINYLNPSDPAHKYSIRYFPIVQQINKEESISKYIDANYAVWINKATKDHHDFLNTHNFDAGTKKKIELEHNIKLKIAQEEFTYLKDNFDSLHIRIIGAEYKNYPTLNYTLDKKKKDRYLKIEIPNCLYFEPKPFRGDWNTTEFIASSNNAFGDVYYMSR